jgi:hypothetical protein
MSKIKLLLDVVSDLRSLADSVQAVANAMADNEPTEALQPKTPAPALETKPVSLEQVRSVLAEKSQDGFTVEVRRLLEKHGATKLSRINPSEYSTLLLEAEALK